jgi:hypothetical protein
VIATLNAAYRLLIAGGLFIIVVGCSYISVRFFRGHFIRNENGITLSLAVFCLALALDHLWSIAAAIYPMFGVGSFFTFVSLTIRFIIVYTVILSMVFIAWKFNEDEKE